MPLDLVWVWVCRSAQTTSSWTEQWTFVCELQIHLGKGAQLQLEVGASSILVRRPPTFFFSPSSALAQDHINIPLKLVSAAARSPRPSLSLSLPLPFFFVPLFLPLYLSAAPRCCFLEGIALQQRGAVLLPSVRSSPRCTGACERSCARAPRGWWIPMPLTDRVDWFRMVAASCRREEWLFLDQGVAGRERLRRALCV